MKTIVSILLALVTAGGLATAKPNIVMVITDDQGYGDLGCTGNPIVKTPHIDALAAESSSLADYHVAPTCSPTRAALLTGHWTDRTGVWHTIAGRSMLRENEITLGQMLKDNGYATGMFGKWHLGDNYPYRPEDRGFDEVYRHGGGGVGQTPDIWDNAYFDGAYFHNGDIEPAKGFCTDVFFEQGEIFIRTSVSEKKPFLAYIALNAPHGPLHAPQKYMDMYADQPKDIQAFYGMITNIDDNVGRIRALLKQLGIYDNTIFIFTTDNGTASGEKVYNAGMRGKKGSPYDGGHRVPFFVHWPAGGMNKQHVASELTHAIDIVPTLLDMTGSTKPAAVKFDGVSIKNLLDPAVDVQWPDRFIITDSQRVVDPIKWRQSAVMSQQWRLINGAELYDIRLDPGQQNNVAKDHPEQVAKMRQFYDRWWAELEPTFSQTTEIYLGHPDHPVVNMTAHDWIGASGTPWHQGFIRNAYPFRPGEQRDPATDKKFVHGGYWAVKVLTDGVYQFSVRRWPVEADQPITASLTPGANVPGATVAYRAVEGKSLDATEVTLRIDGNVVGSKSVSATDREIVFTSRLAKGSHRVSPVFLTPFGEVGAYYITVTKVSAK